MNRKWFSILALIAAATFFFSLSSCGFNQHLVSISIAPSNATFGAVDPTLFVDFTALGTYDHPPETKNITNLVTWQSDTPQVAQFSSAGVLNPNTGCGTANVFASFYDSPNDVVSNSALITVDGPASQGCPQSGALVNLAVTVTAGTGTVTSSPAGINCGSVCAAQFTIDTNVDLIAAPQSPSTAVTWGNCTSISGNVCTVTLATSTVVTATFN
ncbi:MAG: hypothetical protein WCA20_25785 [Candidatus Sulfotelmatobacter sp.]